MGPLNVLLIGHIPNYSYSCAVYGKSDVSSVRKLQPSWYLRLYYPSVAPMADQNTDLMNKYSYV